jgi:hypothetical protein
MTKIVTLRLENALYKKLKKLAAGENRSLSNYIVTAVLKHAEESLFASDEEMAEILSNEILLERIKKGSAQVRKKKGRFVD